MRGAAPSEITAQGRPATKKAASVLAVAARNLAKGGGRKTRFAGRLQALFIWLQNHCQLADMAESICSAASEQQAHAVLAAHERSRACGRRACSALPRAIRGKRASAAPNRRCPQRCRRWRLHGGPCARASARSTGRRPCRACHGHLVRCLHLLLLLFWGVNKLGPLLSWRPCEYFLVRCGMGSSRLSARICLALTGTLQ